jgi:DNA-binding response OmpR family regulator
MTGALEPLLLIEDDPDTVTLLERALRKAGLRREVRVLTDGQEALHYLASEDKAKHPRPCLVLLDLKLPIKTGLEVLAWLRGRSDYRPMPVVMMTGSSATQDIDEALKLGIKAYCVKPVDFKDLLRLARTIRRLVEPHETDREDSETRRFAMLHQA